MAGVLPALLGSISCSRAQEEKDVVVKVAKNETRKGWLGVSLRDMDKDRAREMKVKTTTGALVADVVEESPAQKSGLKEDDIVIEFNGKTIEDAEDLVNAVRKTKPGDKGSVVVMRNNQKKTIEVTLAKPPHESLASLQSFAMPRVPAAPKLLFSPRYEDAAYGLELLDLNPQLGEYFGTPDKKGVLVERVREESDAQKAGFKAGDVIVKIGEDRIEDTRDVWDALEDYKEGDKVSIDILRKGNRSTLALEAKELSQGSDEDMHWHFRTSPMHMNFHGNMWPENEAFREGMKKMQLEIQGMTKKLREDAKDLQLKIKNEVKSALNI